MTDSETTITSGSELESELRDLLQRAHNRGVDVEGAWLCRNGAGAPDWDVVVTELETNEE